MSRLGRSQPVQPFATHGFLGNTPANGTLPGQILVVEPDDRRRKTPPLQPVIISAALLSVAPPATTAPSAPLVVDRADQRVRFRPLDPVVVSGARLVNSGVGVPGTAPPAPVSIDRTDQRIRQFRSPDPVVISGALLSVTPPVVTPPQSVNVDRDDQRTRRRPLDAISISGALASFPPSTANPPAPFVVPLDLRRRILEPPNVTVGYDDVAPPKPNLVETDRRRLLPLDPFTANTLGAATAPAPATPPAPFIVPVDERGRFVVVLPSTGQHGFVDPGPAPVGTPPPPPLNIDRFDPRFGSKPIDPLVLSGLLVPPPPPAVVSGVDDITPVFVTW